MIENNEIAIFTYWNKQEVKKFVGWKGDSTLYRAINLDKFPKPFKLGRGSRWRKDEVIEWMNSLPRAELGGGSYGKDH